MVRELDEKVRLHFKQTDDVFECKYCGNEFKGKPSVTRLRHHLLREKNRGVRACEKVPEHIKVDILAADSNKRRRISESTSVNNEMPNTASTSLPPQNNHLVQEQAALQNEFPATEQVFLESSNPEPSPKQQRTRQDLPSKLVGESHKKKLDEIWSTLRKENVFKVGIYGMGGVGKTELARHIYKRLLERAEYDFVCWITVSPDLNIRKLQNIIANAINFELPNKDVEIIRAELWRRLFDKKFVIILDDLWSYISLDDAGMTDGSLNGCKLIMTTRSLHICRTMNCQENVFVDSQVHDEAWILFERELGKEKILSRRIQAVAIDIVRECAGLPLMIKCMARSMRGVEDIEEWRNAIEEMNSFKMNEEVFYQLKRSYDHLKDQSLRDCFLYCALFEDIYIDSEDLIEHLIVEGIIEGTGNRRAKFDRAHTLLNKLHNVCLLSFNGVNVSIHGLIRKMAFQIMKEKLPSNVEVEFSEEIKYLFMKDKMRISLNVPNEALNPSDYVATCPNVSTLLIRRRHRLTSIEDSFYDWFQNLKVLDLSLSNIEELPKSVGDLKNLKALFLRSCHNLKYIPSLAKLESLEVLNLSSCGECVVPEGVEWLSNLRVLNLFESYAIKLEGGILKRLSRLEFLACREQSELGEEIAGLLKLESLIWFFSGIDEFDSFLSKASSPSLNAYSLCVGDFHSLGVETKEPSCREMRFDECEREYLFCLSSCPTLLRRVENVELYGLYNLRHLFRREKEYEVSPNTTTPQTSPFSDLNTFHISYCGSIKNLFPLHLLSNLQNLQELSVSSCLAMEEIIAAPEQNLTDANSHLNSIQTPHFSLPRLNTLRLKYLPELTSICRAQINCESLHYIKISYCENLKKIPISLPLPSLHVLKVSPETWWESVIWGSSD